MIAKYENYRNDISNRIVQLEDFYDNSFGEDYIEHFEIARLRLKKLLMYEISTINKISKCLDNLKKETYFKDEILNNYDVPLKNNNMSGNMNILSVLENNNNNNNNNNNDTTSYIKNSYNQTVTYSQISNNSNNLYKDKLITNSSFKNCSKQNNKITNVTNLIQETPESKSDINFIIKNQSNLNKKANNKKSFDSKYKINTNSKNYTNNNTNKLYPNLLNNIINLDINNSNMNWKDYTLKILLKDTEYYELVKEKAKLVNIKN